MKKYILTISVLLNFLCFSQQKVAEKISELTSKNTKFESFTIFNSVESSTEKSVNDVVENASLAKLKISDINNIVQNKFEYLEIQIPYQDEIIPIQLFKVNPFAEGFHIDTNKNSNIEYEQGSYYRGIIKGDLKSLVSFNFFKNECNGVISSSKLSNLIVGKLAKNNNLDEYIIYKDSHLKILNTFNCTTKSEINPVQETIEESSKSENSIRCTTFYFEIDFDLYFENGNSTTNTTNWMTSVFNNVQTIFNNDGITTAIKSLYIWTTQDPYDGIGITSAAYLYKFNEIRPVFDGDLGQLIGLDSGGLGGVAVGLNGFCSNNNFSYSDVNLAFNTVPQYSWTINVITHELGHLMGSAHTHDCVWNGNNTRIDSCGPNAGFPGNGDCADNGEIPVDGGTIMSYCHLSGGGGVNLALGFGILPATRIINKANNSSCLSTNCINTCINNVLSSVVSNITPTSAKVDWVEQGNTVSSEVAFYPITSNTGTFTTPITNSFTANNLTPNTYFKAVVRKNCSGGLVGPEIVKIFVTPGDFCSGISLTDSGGSTGDYLDNETVTRVIIPANPGSKATITFTAFDLELDYDYVNIYNGNNDTFPALSSGFGFTGNIIPNPLTSTAIDGALTLKFYSDGGVVAPGYVASVSCSSLGTNDFEKAIDFYYYPNPANSKVTINSKTEISEVTVFNIAGQLLYSNKLNNLSTNIDISEFANGTYFFKLKFNEKEVNFKILKM
jgi:Secretion system C-terminal sorting domain/Metallo-peptidase family M12